MRNPDPYENGTPKYLTASDIKDGLDKLAQAEEIDILSEIAPDVSYEQQNYYYQDKGYELQQRYEKLTDYGEKGWVMDLAVWQIDNADEYTDAAYDVHDFIPMALSNSDFARRIGLKKMFVDTLLRGNARQYEEVSEAFFEELNDLNRNDFIGNAQAFFRVMQETDAPLHNAIMAHRLYDDFSRAMYKRLIGLQLFAETQLIADCRALLTSYDDFILGLRMNQELHKYQEQAFGRKVAELQVAYKQKVAALLAVAEKAGLLPEVGAALKLLEEGSASEKP